MAWAVISSWIGVFDKFRVRIPEQELLQSTHYLFSTIAQVLAAILGIYLAIAFILTQFATKPNYSRIMSELYRDATTVGLIGIYVVTIIYALTVTALAPAIIAHHWWFVLDVGYTLAVGSVVLVVPAAIGQVENLNHVVLAHKLARRITVKRIRAYGLALVDVDSDTGEVAQYSLNRWGHRHGLYDPLGAIHELVVECVKDRDRIRLQAIMRSMVERIAAVCDARLPRVYGISTGHLAHPAYDWWQLPDLGRLSNRRKSTRRYGGTIMALHVQHYVIRRAHNLLVEWPGYDVLRQLLIINNGDVILGLSRRCETELPIRLSLFAIMHICLGFRQFTTWGNYEPCHDLFDLAVELERQQYSGCAELTLAMIAYLRIHCQFISNRVFHERSREMPTRLKVVLREARRRLERDPEAPLWGDDPWAYMVPGYHL